MPVISNSELILRKMQAAEEAKEAEARQWEASAAERAHKMKMAEQRAAKQAVLEKARQADIKEVFNDKERVFKMCEIGDHEGLWSLLRKLQRDEEKGGSLNSSGGVKSLVGATTKDGATPLYYACKNGFLECARVLLEFGCTTRGTDSGGFTPLWVACARGQFECAELMLKQPSARPGASADQRARDGRTPLYAACEGGNLPCVRMMLDAKADIEARRADMSTPLIVASVFGHADVVEALLQAGALLLPSDEDGTALDNARRNKKGGECVALLEASMKLRGKLEQSSNSLDDEID